MNHSPNSREVEKLRREAEGLKQTILHRQNEARAVLQSLQQLNQKVKSQTDKLLAEQANKLAEERLSLESELRVLKADIISCENHLKSLKDSIDKSHKQREKKSQELNSVLGQIKDSKDELNSASEELESLQSTCIITKQQLEDLKNSIGESQKELESTNLSIDEAKNTKSEINKQIEEDKKQFEADKAERELVISALDSKIVDLANTLEDRRREELTTRSDLAIWEKSLEERDLNLRIREEKVNQGETKIIRNSQLMDL